MNILFKDLTVDFEDRFQLKNINWQISRQQNWMIIGPNGAGKSALVASIKGVGKVLSGSVTGLPARVGLVSSEGQAELISQELRKDDADLLDVISEGTLVSEILLRDSCNSILREELIKKFSFAHLLNRALRKLSSGETRKLMLICALANDPDVLILDEPFAGLDADSSIALTQHLQNIVGIVPMLLVLNRLDQCPDFVTHVAYVNDGCLEHTIKRNDKAAIADLYKLMHIRTTDHQVPAADDADQLPTLDPEQPLVRLRKAAIRYSDVEIFSDLDWVIEQNQHWQLSGPNGSGKTSLLSLITGDHPQCYTNDIYVFGFQRGSGESIWQIKQYIGYVSSALHWEYRVSISLRNVIISGFYDSIGLYRESTPSQQTIADQWLALLGMSDQSNRPFQELSYGDQRLLLIARAMVKHPPLLILDEPCLGLDEINRQLVLALIQKVCASKTTSVIYVSHHQEDRITGINNSISLVQ